MLTAQAVLGDHLHMDVYRVNFGEWYPSQEEAVASADGGLVHTIEQGEQAADGSVRLIRITLND